MNFTVRPKEGRRRAGEPTRRRATGDSHASSTRATLPLVPTAKLLQPRRTPLLLVTDILMLLAAGAVATAARPGLSVEKAVFFGGCALLVMVLRGAYRAHLRRAVIDDLAVAIVAVGVATMATTTAAEVFGLPYSSVAQLVPDSIAVVAFLTFGRGMLALMRRSAWATPRFGSPVLIIGHGPVAGRVAERISEHPEYGLRPLGVITTDSAVVDDASLVNLPVLGRPRDLLDVIEARDVRHVILAFSETSDESLVSALQACGRMGVEVLAVPRFFELANERTRIQHIGGLPVMRIQQTNPLGLGFAFKHAIDRSVALIALVVLAPVLGLLALATKLTTGGPVLFNQRRVGRDGRPFVIHKFRSMRSASGGSGPFVPTAGQAPGGVEGTDRRTALGRWMRRTSLDELPQLLNVLKGDMSLVGPRPERPEFVEKFAGEIDRYDERHRVRPGITGWAQVHGLRGQTPIGKRVEWDNYYIDNWSLWLDVKIVLLTLSAVIRSGEDPAVPVAAVDPHPRRGARANTQQFRARRQHSSTRG
jgi:exopolysaccharide biosynthesis polyprenyl glycosylphosphotransferase